MWPFKKGPEGERDLPAVTDESTWTIAKGTHGDDLLIVRRNAGGEEWRSHPKLPIKLGFAVPFHEPDEHGFPGSDEDQQIGHIEDKIRAEVAAVTKGIHVLVIVTGGMKEFVFYIPEGVDIAALHAAVQAAVDTREVQCIAEVETDWVSYEQFMID